MTTMKLEISPSGYWYSDEEYGPPLPHSLWLWELWGCYEHYNCVLFVDPMTPKGEKDRLIHTPVEELRTEVNSAPKHADTCECWRHWLLGDMAHKDYPQTFEPIIRMNRKGPKRD